MKFASTLAALAVVASAHALAVVSKREADPWCDLPGQPCWKEKRDAAPWCDLPGQPCWKAKRAAEALASAVGGFDSALAARNPDAMGSDADGYHAYVARRSVEHLANVVAVAARDAAPEEFVSRLSLEKKFAAEPAPERREAEPWCDLPGQPCWKRAVQEDKRWCDLPGQPCWKAKRAAEAVAGEIGQIKEREAEPWCDLPGQPCWKEKRDANPEATPWCDLPGQPCWKGRRDLHAMKNAAREVLEALA